MDRKSLVTPRAAVEIVASHRTLKVGSRSSPEVETGLFLCVCVCLRTLWHIRNRGWIQDFSKRAERGG